MATFEEARAAKKEFLRQYREHPEVTAVGVGMDNCVAVRLVNQRPDSFPDTVLGVPVEYRIVGEISAL